jgi:hypothetical protein
LKISRLNSKYKYEYKFNKKKGKTMSIKFEETVKETIARDEINKKLSLCKCPFYLITGANRDINQERIEELEIREVERESIAILNAEKRIRPNVVSMIGNETAIFFTEKG